MIHACKDMQRITHLLLLLACGSIAAFPITITLNCGGVDFLSTPTLTVNCPGFQVSGGTISGVTSLQSATAVFLSPGSATVTNDIISAAAFNIDPSTMILANPAPVSDSVFSSATSALGGVSFSQFTINASGTVNAGAPIVFQGCYAVSYTYSGNGTATGPGNAPGCGGSGYPAFDPGAGPTVPEPSTAWLMLPALVGCAVARRKRLMELLRRNWGAQ